MRADGSSASSIRSGTSIPAPRPRRIFRSPSRCCSIGLASNAESARPLWGFSPLLARSHPRATLPARRDWSPTPSLLRDFVLPAKTFARRARRARRLIDLRDALSQLPAGASGSRSRRWSTRSAGGALSSTTRGKIKTKDGKPRRLARLVQTCSIRCCSARRRARASAPSSRLRLAEHIDMTTARSRARRDAPRTPLIPRKRDPDHSRNPTA